MREHTCIYCDKPFHPRQFGQRFCSRPCGLEWHQRERRIALAAYREGREAEQQEEQRT
jgi:hypothetical protein